MAFLTLNGMRILVAGGTRNHEDTGRAGRTATGSLTRDRRFVARRWQFTTPPMSLLDYEMLRGITAGQAYTWPFDNNGNSNLPTDALVSNSFANFAYASATAADGTAVVPGSRYGTHSIMSTQAGTNSWPSNVATGTDTSANTSGFTAIAGGVITSDSTRKWQGSRSLKVVAATAGDGVRTNAVNAGSNGYEWTETFYVTGTGAALTATMYASSTVLGAVTVTPDGTWQRIVIPRNANAITAFNDHHVKFTAAGAGTYYLDGLLLENTTGAVGPLPQPWVDGSRSAAVSLVRLPSGQSFASANGCSLNIWTTQIYNVGGVLVQLSPGASSVAQFAIRCVTQLGASYFQGTIPAAVVTDLSANSVVLPLAAAPTYPTLGTWHMITAVAKPRPPQGGYTLYIYLDGVLSAKTTTAISSLDFTTLDALSVGHGHGTWTCRSQLDDLTVFPYVLGPTAIKGIYDSGAAMPSSWPVLTASGAAMGNTSVSVLAQVEKAEFTAFVDSSGKFQNNGVTASITLMEAA